MLVEGSYPYVTGGVASWIQMVIQSMPEHEFIIHSIGAEEKQKGQFKYQLPANLTAIHEVFLDSILNLKNPPTAKYKLSQQECSNLAVLLSGAAGLDFDLLLHTIRFSTQSKNPLDIFMSFEFFEAIKEGYRKDFALLPFTEFFWTVRSMLLPFFYILKQDFPAADLYHSVATGYAGVVGSVASTIYNKPLLLTEHGIYSREREEELIKCSWVKGDFKSLWIKFFYSLASITYQKAAKVFTLFNRNLETQVELGCPREKISIIPNGINLSQYENLPQKDAHDTAVNIGAIVRVVPIKDILTMIRSFAIVKQRIPNAKLYIMGTKEEDKEYYAACERLVASLSLADVIFTGNVNIKEYIGKMDIMMLTSISEGQPLAVIEAMAAKKPVVATDVGCCKELMYGVNDGIGPAGIIVTVIDFEGMAKAVIQLAKNPELRQEMGVNGYERARRNHQLQDFINQYKEVYRDIGETAWQG
jgi:glycosyltransferase involved in cell wall biosynthesis